MDTKCNETTVLLLESFYISIGYILQEKSSFQLVEDLAVGNPFAATTSDFTPDDGQSDFIVRTRDDNRLCVFSWRDCFLLSPREPLR